MINHDNGQTFKTIYDNLTIRGYNVVYKVLDTCKITGVPQHRERIYIFGYKIIGNKFLNQSNNTIQLLNSLLDFDQIYVKPITDFLQATNEIPDKYYYTPKSKIYPKLLESVTKYNTVYQYRRTYVRENMSGVVPTLTENMGSGGHNIPIILDSKGIRKLTPRECFNFQGFPSNYNIDGLSDSQLYRLAGNAVTYKIVEMIALKLKNILFGY